MKCLAHGVYPGLMNVTIWLAGCVLALATASGCGEDDSSSAADVECDELLSEKMPTPQGTSALRPDPDTMGAMAERIDLNLDPNDAAETERLDIALCNDPPAGQERVVLDEGGRRRCAFGLKPDAADVATGRCE